MPAGFEVRITPLIRGVPGEDEQYGTGRTEVTLAETTELTQFADVEVNTEINAGRTASVKISMYDPLLANLNLEPYEFALWIGYFRPEEVQSECVFWGQAWADTHFKEGTITIHGEDPVAKCQHHYVRRGDAALNIDGQRGRLKAHPWELETVLQAARNTQEQQDRNMPCLAFDTFDTANFEGYDDAPYIMFERGQEVWDLCSQIIRSAWGPDVDIVPNAWTFPTDRYASIWMHETHKEANVWSPTELGRFLDPVNPDDPQDGEIIFEYGPVRPPDPGDPSAPRGLDNLEDVNENPGKPTTHAHVVDSSQYYRETSADAASSLDIGAWVGWNGVNFEIERPDQGMEPDTTPLKAIADSTVRAYGKPPKFFTCELRPSDAQPFHYGHPLWSASVPGIRIGGDWYLGDYVRVRAAKGYMTFSTLARITGVKLTKEGWVGLPRISIDCVPAVGGTPGTVYSDGDESVFQKTVTIVTPSSGSSVDGTVEAVAITNFDTAGIQFQLDGVDLGVEDTSSPYEISFDSTDFADGVHTLTAIARDSGGHVTTVNISITIDNAAPAPPPPTPPAGNNNLYVDGRKFRLKTNGAFVPLRGFNIHTWEGGGFSQDRFNAIAALNMNANRVCTQWRHVEPTAPGVFSASQIGWIRTSINRNTAAGMNTILCLCITSPDWAYRTSHLPAWSYTSTGPTTPDAPWTTASLFDVMASNGEAYIKKMVDEFGADPNVVAFEFMNEPDRMPASVIQSGTNRMLDWARSRPNAAGKLWFVATNAYSSQSAEATFNDWNAIIDWTGVVLTMHCYLAPNASGPTDDFWKDSDGVRKVDTGAFWNGVPEANSYNTAHKAALIKHFASWRDLSIAKNVPWVIGEVGVQYNKATMTQRDTWMKDVLEAASATGCAGVLGWIYGVNEVQDPWTASYPSSAPVFRPEYARIGTYNG